MTALWDGLVFLGPSLFGRDVSPAAVLPGLDTAGIDGCVVVPNKPPDYHLPPANDLVLEYAAEHPERVAALCRVDPWRRDAVSEVRRTHAEGARGVLLHPWEECFSIADEVVLPVVAVAADLGLPVVVPGGFPWMSEALQVADLAARFPALRFVVTNGAQLNMSGLAGGDVDLALRTCENICLQVSGLYRQDFLEKAVVSIGAERIAFGSSAPYFDQRLEAERMRRTRYASERDAALVGHENTRSWFAIEGAHR